jgi:hypothetical protein
MLPPEYDQLTEAQRKGEEYIFPGLPAVRWHADLAGARSMAETKPALGYAVVSPRHPDQPTWKMLKIWKRLSRLGFVPTGD